MIIGDAFRRLFAGFTVNLTVDGQAVNDKSVNFHYGDHKELIKWIADKDKSNSNKYPLIWYVIAPYQELNGVYYCESQLIIFQNTKIGWFNTDRFVKTYTEIIEPVFRGMRDIIEASPYVHPEGSSLKERYRIKDEPNYGVNPDATRLSQNEFARASNKENESVSLDFVDGKIINFKFRIQPDCIN